MARTAICSINSPDGSNHRTDAYGGTVENRARLPLEVTKAVIDVWGGDRVGYRISPNSPFNSMSDSDPVQTFSYLTVQLNRLGLVYLHVVDPISNGTKRVSPLLRRKFDRTYIVNGASIWTAPMLQFEAAKPILSLSARRFLRIRICLSGIRVGRRSTCLIRRRSMRGKTEASPIIQL